MNGVEEDGAVIRSCVTLLTETAAFTSSFVCYVLLKWIEMFERVAYKLLL